MHIKLQLDGKTLISNQSKNNMNQYESPTIEIQEILVEKGFLGSGGYSPGGGSSSSGIEGGLGGSEGMGGGGDINVGW